MTSSTHRFAFVKKPPHLRLLVFRIAVASLSLFARSAWAAAGDIYVAGPATSTDIGQTHSVVSRIARSGNISTFAKDFANRRALRFDPAGNVYYSMASSSDSTARALIEFYNL